MSVGDNKAVRIGPKGSVAEEKHYYQVCNEVFELDSKYEAIEMVGRGSSGMVCSAFNRDTKEIVAIKKIKEKFEFESNGQSTGRRTLREIRLVRQMNHPFVIRIKDVLKPHESERTIFKDIYVVYELMHTNLEKIFRTRKRINDEDCKLFINQMLRVLKYLHSVNVVHRDMKPSNILVDKNNRIKLCDFGLARPAPAKGHTMTVNTGTLWYMAPEALLGCPKYNESVDIWSVGCIFARMLGGGCPLFQGVNIPDQLQEIGSVIPKPNDDHLWKPLRELVGRVACPLPTNSLQRKFRNADPAAIDLLEKMLVYNPRKRITPTRALHHPYMASITVDILQHKLKLSPLDVEILKKLENLDDDDLGNARLSNEEIREKIWNEILMYHPQNIH